MLYCRIILLLVIGFSFFGNGFAQPYYLETIGKLQYFTQDLDCDTCYFSVAADTIPQGPGGLSFGPDGFLYCLTHPPDNQIYRIDVTNGNSTLIYNDAYNNLQMGGFMAMGGGIFYSIPNFLEPNDSLYLWDTNLDTVYGVGELPYSPFGEMWMVNGEVYYLSYQQGGSRRIIRLNLSAPEESEIALEFSPDYVIYALTATPVGNVLMGTENSFFYPGKHVVTLNLTDGTINKYCKIPKPASHGQLRSVTSISEHADSPLLLQVDLDCNNSSGATGDNFNGNSVDCFTEGGVPITDEDIVMFIDARISTMTISVANPLDDPEEVFTITGALNGISVDGEGTNTLILTSEGTAKISDFQEALKLVRYHNLSLSPTGGMRNIEVFFETESGNTCEIATAFINVIEGDQIELDLGPDIDLCEGSTVILDPGINQVNYLWSTGETTSSIEISDGGTYSLTVSGGIDCPNSDEVEVILLPLYQLILDGDSILCTGEDILLTVTTDAPFPIDIEFSMDPGSPTWYYGVESGFVIVDSPLQPTDYFISTVIAEEPACFTYDQAWQSIDILPGLSLNDSVSICEGDSILLGQTWQSIPGDYTVIHPAAQGCDTVVTYSLSLNPIEQQFVSGVTCDSSLAGISITWLNNPNGCDTMRTNTITWVSPDTTYVNQTTCRQVDAGVFTTGLSNQYGCDSLIITNMSWTPPADTTYTTQTSCDSAQIGVFTSYVTNHLGCDSLIIRTVNAGIPDTTLRNTTSCDPSSLGVFVTHFTNTQSCDSIVITTVSFSAQDSVFISGSSCDPGQTGVFVSTFTNQFGCDSIVTQTIDLLPVDNVFLQSVTCDPGAAGVFISTLVNQHGCDSIIHETVALLPHDEVFLYSTTCTSASAGVFVSTLVNQYGCDSIITETITLLPSDTSVLIDFTCDPTEVKKVETLFMGQDGCDSLVLESIELFQLPDLILQAASDYNGFNISCQNADDGVITSVLQGIPPFNYQWSNGSIEPILSGLSAGTYVLSVTDGNGCVTSSEMVLTEPEPFTIGFEIAEPDCFDQQLGTITVQSNGGVAPYTYSLDGGSVQASPVFNGLGEGVYQVTAIDANDCHATEIISLNVPLMVDVELGDDHFISIGDSVIIQAIVNLPFDSIASLSWTGVDSAHCQGCLIQLVAPVITTSYSVSVISMDGCTDQDSLNILVNTDSGMYIPNVFSPNGDGINDVFSFTLRDDVTEISSFSIFDRWGNMTYSVESILPSDPSKAWDGKMNGQLMNPGVFTYKLILKMKDGSLDVRYGDITLIR